MNERLHEYLDKVARGEESDFAFEGAAEKAEFEEHLALNRALAENQSTETLSGAEKNAIFASVAGSVGLAQSGTTDAAISGGGFVGRMFVTLLAGAILGSAITFFAVDSGSDPPTQIGVPISSATPAAFPFAVPEAPRGPNCDSVVQALRDSLAAENAPEPKSRSRRSRSSWKSKYDGYGSAGTENE